MKIEGNNFGFFLDEKKTDKILKELNVLFSPWGGYSDSLEVDCPALFSLGEELYSKKKEAMKKYKLTKTTNQQGLHQIIALRDFGNIKKGDLGGWVESEKNLSQDGLCWVSGNAKVYGNAQVSGNALVSGNVWVFGAAKVSGNAEVYGNAWVYGNVEVHGDAWVSGDAKVYDNARVYGNALVSGDAWVYGNARVYEKARVSGNSWVYGNAQVYGDVKIYDNAQVFK